MNRDQVYVAASWRTPSQPTVVAALRTRGLTVYDFRNPPNSAGFGWEQLGEQATPEGPKSWKNWTPQEYVQMLNHPRAQEGFDADMHALTNAYIVVLVQPSGRSAALEFGYACAKGKRTAVLLAPGQEPELMLKMAERFFFDLDALVEWAAHIPGL